MNISTCMGVLRGLYMTQAAYGHFRRVYPNEELCISANDPETAEWLESLDDSNLRWAYTPDKISFGENYNRAVDLATKDKIVLYHNDMVPAPKFLEMLNRNVNPMSVVGYTTIEPPVFKDHVRPGKLIQNFGDNFDNFNLHKFEHFTRTYHADRSSFDSSAMSDNFTPGVFFFLSCFTSVFKEIGGFDGETFNPVFCEDDDFIMRLLHRGCTLQTTDMAMVYHFVSQTIRFSEVPRVEWNSSSEDVEIRSIRNFIRKWGKKYNGYETKKANVLDIGYRITNATPKIVELLEPFARNLQVDTDTTEYMTKEQPYTTVDLAAKFVPDLTNAAVVDIDATILVPHTYNVLTEISRVVNEQSPVGQFKYGPYTVTINRTAHNLVDTLIIHTRK